MFEFAPILQMALNAWATVEFHLYFINIKFEPWIQPYAFTPMDVTIRVDPMKPQRWCYGMDYYGESLIFAINYEQDVRECHYGIFGHLVPNVYNDPRALDCVWRYYKPENYLYKAQITKAADFYGNYVPYKCMNWMSADWEDWPLSEETIDEARREGRNSQ